MISITLFVFILITGMTALLNANLINNKSRDMRSIVDNLSFIMEDMSRNIRVGYNYKCITDGDFNDLSRLNTPGSCVSGGALAFEIADGFESDLNDQWIYQIISNDGGQTYFIRKSVDSGSTWIKLNSDEILISPISGFSVLGAETASSGDLKQPLVLIRLVGEIRYKNIITPFSLQTTVSQRVIDVAS